MKTLLTTLSLSLLLLAGCKKNHIKGVENFDCQHFKAGIINDSTALVGTEVNKLCEDLMPAPTATDAYGQGQNINILVQRLSQQCDVTATLVCYACIETYPAQSEIRISLNQNGVVYHRTLDITVDPQNMLSYNGMHE